MSGMSEKELEKLIEQAVGIEGVAAEETLKAL